ncbi:hypothetical protein SPRG_12050 [Saprolegnia parasitica CBS 223.65]|uniref:C2 domain-containing protein n=1 Tax=Saprolegnia parasitica (strain CBS 223.65) TaxID=695850 RepID=A0A067BUW3_SAPPC|nr:hypothetical protein SPRG_12050 [Saprolegnia parasitica CBS 223.65]KDO22063.1 hypothetical protein SPRG_12050 [Saprolegnia parasitica CBS 223.65]|eukprot:XP_012207207.1 hypothetical protein SPRG_12050 [Saprolegnia parasitica CBS 223.65]
MALVPDRLLRFELHNVVEADAVLASSCFGGVLQSVVYAELRLLGRGGALQTACVHPTETWQHQVFEFALSEAEAASRVLHVTLHAIDLFGFASRLGETHVPLGPLDADKHVAEIPLVLPLFESDGDSTVQTCSVHASAAVWTRDDLAIGATLDVWEYERYAEAWSSQNLLPTDARTALDDTALPVVPPTHVPSLGWFPEVHSGDTHGWYYAATFAGPWHNSMGANCYCRRRRLLRRSLPADVQAQKKELADLLRQDHAVTVHELLAARDALATLMEQYQQAQNEHTAAMERQQREAAAALAAATATHQATLQDVTDAHAATQATLAARTADVEALRARIAELELETSRWRYANEQRISKKQLKVDSRLKSLSMAPRLLRVQLVRCEDLAAADSALMGGKSDPYVTFYLGDKKVKSTQFSNELNPVWDHEVFEFQITEGAMYTEVLQIVVSDHDTVGADEVIGTASVALQPLEDSAANNNCNTNKGNNDTNIKKQDAADEVVLPLDIPSEFSSQRVHSSIVLRFEVLPGPPVTTLQVWENERYASRKWSSAHLLPSERQTWSVGSASHASRDNVAPPLPPSTEGSALGWTIDRTQGDVHGWFYAKSFEGPWVNTSNSSSVVRRRVWSNPCHAAIVS